MTAAFYDATWFFASDWPELAFEDLDQLRRKKCQDVVDAINAGAAQGEAMAAMMPYKAEALAAEDERGSLAMMDELVAARLLDKCDVCKGYSAARWPCPICDFDLDDDEED